MSRQQHPNRSRKKESWKWMKRSSHLYVLFLGILLTTFLNLVFLNWFTVSIEDGVSDSLAGFSGTRGGVAVSWSRIHAQPAMESLQLPLSSSLSHDQTAARPEISACLIVMDDNHFLIEWLAYHYHTANLRHLIITSDPLSRTSPSKVLDRWRDRISIQELNETDFLPEDFEQRIKDMSYGEKQLLIMNNHRVRQRTFNLECLREFKRQDRGWTMLIDSDEYLTLKEEPATSLEKSQNQNQNQTIRNPVANATMTVTATAPDVLRSLQIPPGFETIFSACLTMNRVQFSAAESLNEEVQAMVDPTLFDGKDFQTLRWRKYGHKTPYTKTKFKSSCGAIRNIPNKHIINLARVTPEDLSNEENNGNPHRPLDICSDNPYGNMQETPLVLNHYVGTPEQWFYRSNDKRGTGHRRARYEDVNDRFGIKESDALRPWLKGFVEAVGSDEASRLLKNVGRLEPLVVENSTVAVDVDVPKYNDTLQNTYKVGDTVWANFAGEGTWSRAEIYAAYSNDFYSVFFRDCSQEIATFADRLRPEDWDPMAMAEATEHPTEVTTQGPTEGEEEIEEDM